MSERKYSYANEQLRVDYYPGRCNHIGRCVRQLNNVFDPERKPWVDVDQGDPDEIVAAIESCPTGALTVTRFDGGQGENVPDQTMIQAVEGGPFWINGHVQLKDETGRLISRETRIALCRCSKSSNQPFCDGSHRHHCEG